MKIKDFRKMKPRTGVVIFLLFFGTAFLEAFRTRNWIAVGYWSLIAFVFLLLDNATKATDNDKEAV
jgi:hypothetical protein